MPRSEFMRQLSPSDAKYKDFIGQNARRETPHLTNKLGDEEELKSLSSIHSSLGRADHAD